MRLNVHAWGDTGAAAIVCLHGLSAHGRRFSRLAEERLQQRYRVLSFDLRGHGHSPTVPPWSLDTHVADVLETADHCGVGAAIWIGESFGGRLVLELGAIAPERVERAILLDPGLQQTPEKSLQHAEGERTERLYRSAEEALRERKTLPLLARTPEECIVGEIRDHLAELPGGLFRFRYCHSTAVTVWGELCKPLPSLPPIPTLMITGRDSGFVTDAQTADLRARLSDTLVEATVPGGHVVLWDGYAETADSIDAFLH
jgi:lipase